MRRLILLLFFSNSLAVTADQNSRQQQAELSKLRQEISQYEQRLSQKQATEETVLDYISSLDHEIDLSRAYLSTLRKDINNRSKQIQFYQENIESIEKELADLKELVKKRLVRFYKQRRRQTYELLLSSRSSSQIGAWLNYQKLIVENDKRILNALREKQNNLVVQQNLVRAELVEKEKAIAKTVDTDKRLNESRTSRQQYLTAIRQDKSYLLKRIEEIKSAEKQIRGFISKSEERRKTDQIQISEAVKELPRIQRTHQFAELQGRLNWPVRGQVVSHFGRYRHPKLNTITENLGIEIAAPLGAHVCSVDDGIVQTITWQRGRGNIVIISHDEGYYTVYTHLAEIFIETSEYVPRGHVIGTVGDSGTFGQSILHFQIWKNTKNLNPEVWLSKG
ncbi:peptidoglycan DD-metalloendopeptidase family protein [candidate division KSB1 bacterium]|nr:peptidoglycan DD-metalloendopeptidase family protein [candidate division KSB1 bacterium]